MRLMGLVMGLMRLMRLMRLWTVRKRSEARKAGTAEYRCAKLVYV